MYIMDEYGYEYHNIYTHDEKPINYWREQKKDLAIPLQKREDDCKFTGMCYKRRPAGLVREQFTPDNVAQVGQTAQAVQTVAMQANTIGGFVAGLSNTTILFMIVIILLCFVVYHLKKLTNAIMYQNMLRPKLEYSI